MLFRCGSGECISQTDREVQQLKQRDIASEVEIRFIREWLLCHLGEDESDWADFEQCALALILAAQYHHIPLSCSDSLQKSTQGYEKAGEICI
ncbi:hypothetical protein ACROYT_G014480 [Oculina patagonica]